MKTLNVTSARSVWLFDLGDLNPRGKDIYGDLLDWLKENYSFAKAPSSVGDVDPTTKGYKFEQGSFQAKEEIFISVDLEIYNDGIVGNSRSSTHDTDKFLEDMLENAARDFSLVYGHDIIRTKMYTSELTVRMESVLFNLNPKLVDIANNVSSLCGLSIPPFEMTGFSFSTDLAISPLKPAPFILERKAGAPFSEKRYYSKAPLHTDKHEEVLAGIEHILAGTLAK